MDDHLPTLEQSEAEERRLLRERIAELRGFPCDLRTNWALDVAIGYELNEASIRLRFNLARGVFPDD